MPDQLRLFGTDAPRPAIELHEAGRLTFELIEGGIHAVRFDGIEVIRAVTFPVRDRDWGTLKPQLGPVGITRTDGTLELSWGAEFRYGGARLAAAFTLTAGGNRLTFRATATSNGTFETNRTGFTILHPVAASGCPLVVGHSDGSQEPGCFPELIEPWQPFKDIRSIEHRQQGITVSCILEGDTFEMEDQRQWSDASFKTYNRPLALPWPYLLRDGEVLEQSVSLGFSGKAESPGTPNAPLTVSVGRMTGSRVPDLALVLTAEEAREALGKPELMAAVAPQRITAHVDGESGVGDLTVFARLAEVMNARVDLEYAARCDGDLDLEFHDLAEALKSAGLPLASILVCPSVDRQSTPPGSEWPACPPLETVHAAVARAFPDIPRGGGMLSYFPEFNRKRPPVGMLDFVAHGTNPIVHAADDRSVMQTLTALPWILRSGRAIAGAMPYRLGLSSIPMRQNPYGSRTMENPHRQRICMAQGDPRHFADFGAAFTLGYLAAIAPFGIDAWTPAAGAGPRGISVDGTLSPLGRLLSDLSKRAGATVRAVSVSDPERLAALATDRMLLIANLTDNPVEVTIDGSTKIGLGPYGTGATDL